MSNIITETAIRPFTATSNAIVTNSGKVTGQRFTLGTMTALQVKEQGKTLGHTGKALKNFIAKTLSDEATNRTVSALAFVSHAQANGYVADIAEVRKNTAVLKFVQADTTEAKSLKAQAELAEEKARTEAMAAQIADLQRMLAELTRQDGEANRDAKKTAGK